MSFSLLSFCILFLGQCQFGMYFRSQYSTFSKVILINSFFGGQYPFIKHVFEGSVLFIKLHFWSQHISNIAQGVCHRPPTPASLWSVSRLPFHTLLFGRTTLCVMFDSTSSFDQHIKDITNLPSFTCTLLPQLCSFQCSSYTLDLLSNQIPPPPVLFPGEKSTLRPSGFPVNPSAVDANGDNVVDCHIL